jgi:hypothetical protein
MWRTVGSAIRRFADPGAENYGLAAARTALVIAVAPK